MNAMRDRRRELEKRTEELLEKIRETIKLVETLSDLRYVAKSIDKLVIGEDGPCKN